MPWAKLDDRFPDHPKVAKAGGDAAWLYVAALCYANAHLTNGTIPAAIIPRLTDRKNPIALAERLVAVGLFDRAGEDEYMIHDYLDENDDADTVLAKREAIAAKRRAAGLAGGKRSGEARRQANAKQNAKQIASPSLAGCLDQIEAKTNPDTDTDAFQYGRETTRAMPVAPATATTTPSRSAIEAAWIKHCQSGRGVCAPALPGVADALVPFVSALGKPADDVPEIALAEWQRLRHSRDPGFEGGITAAAFVRLAPQVLAHILGEPIQRKGESSAAIKASSPPPLKDWREIAAANGVKVPQ